MKRTDLALVLSLSLFGALLGVGCATTPQAATPVAAGTSANAVDTASDAGDRSPSSKGVVENYPMLERIAGSGQELAENTKDWMKKWKGMDLEDSSTYAFKELSGSTSINLKISKKDPSDPSGFKSRGSFVARNSAANPNIEVASFHLAALLGYDRIYRPAVRYELGPKASASFKALIDRTTIKGTQRLENKTRILEAMKAGPLKGCLKAKNPDSEFALEAMVNSSAAPNGAPKSAHPIIASLQASNSQPKSGQSLLLARGYSGDALELAREYSVMMTIDSVMQQWDRYSGGNVLIQKDKAGKAHFYGGDNGGADISKTTGWTERNLNWFSRYDRATIDKFEAINHFLKNPASGYLGYTSAEAFVMDLGLTSELAPAVYVERLRRNIDLLLARVHEVEKKYGSQAYLD